MKRNISPPKTVAGLNLRIHIVPAFIAFALLLSACATIPLAPPEEDQAAKAMAPEEGRALIYVCRKGSYGAFVLYPVWVNRQLIGELAADTYFVLDVPPGIYTVRMGSGPAGVQTVVNAEEGQANWVVRSAGGLPGFYRRWGITAMPEKEGREALEECKLAKTVKL